jgi:hypothetical protein
MEQILDFTKNNRKSQNEIMMQKIVNERFAVEMVDDYRKNIEDSIINENPQISQVDLKIEVFKRFYKNDFSEEKMGDIVKGFREYYSKLVS